MFVARPLIILVCLVRVMCTCRSGLLGGLSAFGELHQLLLLAVQATVGQVQNCSQVRFLLALAVAFVPAIWLLRAAQAGELEWLATRRLLISTMMCAVRFTFFLLQFQLVSMELDNAFLRFAFLQCTCR